MSRIPMVQYAVVVGLVMVLAIPGCSQRLPSPAELAQEALQGAGEEAQELAAVELAEVANSKDFRPELIEEAKQQLRRVLGASQTPGVRAACIQGLSSQWDYESMPMFLDALDDESELVRSRAWVSVERMMSADLGSFGYRYDDPPAKRASSINRIRQDWDERRDSPVMKNWLKRLKAKAES